ncbi:MAG TPA: asparagine--tRNA ligase [Clostridia bacterium]|jgi:asparaginyl-tRNA synthetase|nr:asparagine--tRNA ligase [Clostridia bacterium]HQC67858.1 asparagine--tRNA ligase [Clostridia bacterium]
MKISVQKLYDSPNDYKDKTVTVEGWVRTIRSSKDFGFIELNDGTCFKNIQIVFENNVVNNYAEVEKLPVASSISVTGKIILTPEAKQPFEIKAEDIEICGVSASDYPLQKKRHSFEYLRTVAHLRPRTNTFFAVFKVRSVLAQAIHTFFQDRGFVYVHTPIITASDCEGAGEMFQVTTLDLDRIAGSKEKVDYSKDFFGKQTNLTVSGQLSVETYCMAFRNVYTFGPTFRAENSNTPRHASEFWMIEPEMAFADLDDDMSMAEQMIKYIINYVMERCPDEMEFFNKFIEPGLFDKLKIVTDSKFDHVTYTEAIKILKESKVLFENPVEWGCDLQTEHERYLTEKHFKKPVFVTDYPKAIKAFYMKVNDDNKTVRAMDLLVPQVGEIIGGSQREERHDVLVARMMEMGLAPEDYWWYLDTRKYGTVKHAGFGLGFERMIMYMTGMSNIRDVIPFPRVPKHAEF